MQLQLFKFKTMVFILILSAKVMSFSDEDCLKGSFQAKISHKGSPFGLTERILKLKKKGCEIEILHEKLKFIKESWLVDICREPVHIKKTKGAIKVLRKQVSCSGQEDPFCEEFDKMRAVIQNDGLIFAKGEKEDLQADHGKVYCTYLLFKAYAERGIIFSRSKKYQQILREEPPPPLLPSRSSGTHDDLPGSKNGGRGGDGSSDEASGGSGSF